MLYSAAMKELLSKMLRPAVKRAAVAHLRAWMSRWERRACQMIGADRKTVRQAPRHGTAPRLRDLVNERRRFGYWRLVVLLRREDERSTRAPAGKATICPRGSAAAEAMRPGPPTRTTTGNVRSSERSRAGRRGSVAAATGHQCPATSSPARTPDRSRSRVRRSDTVAGRPSLTLLAHSDHIH